MLGNGIATHVAFLAIGLPRLLPAIDGTALQYAAWFGPVGVAIIAKRVIDRRSLPAARLPLTGSDVADNVLWRSNTL